MNRVPLLGGTEKMLTLLRTSRRPVITSVACPPLLENYRFCAIVLNSSTVALLFLDLLRTL